jgi:hypothetical protein
MENKAAVLLVSLFRSRIGSDIHFTRPGDGVIQQVFSIRQKAMMASRAFVAKSGLCSLACTS